MKKGRRSRIVAIAVLALGTMLAMVSSSPDARADEAAPATAAGEIRELVLRMDDAHPDLYRTTSRADFQRATDELVARLPSLSRDQAVVEVMKLVALAGARNGHTAVFPMADTNPRPFHVYPLQLYRFADGLFLIRAPEHADLVGSRLVAVQGVPLAEVETLVAPTVARDNDWDLAARLPLYLLTAEVLHGLGVTPTAASATFTFEGPNGRREVTLEPVAVPTYQQAFPHPVRLEPTSALPPARQPRYLRLSDKQRWVATIERGRTVYAGYNATFAAWDLAREIARRARGKKVRRVVVDLRLNGGGNNTQYYDLLEVLRRRDVSRGGRLRVLIGRHTYSAAGNLAADIDTSTRARLYGEPTGGSPSNWGDSTPVVLRTLGIAVYVATSYQQYGDERALATNPDVRIDLTSADYFAGRDPVLEAALR